MLNDITLSFIAHFFLPFAFFVSHYLSDTSTSLVSMRQTLSLFFHPIHRPVARSSSYSSLWVGVYQLHSLTFQISSQNIPQGLRKRLHISLVFSSCMYLCSAVMHCLHTSVLHNYTNIHVLLSFFWCPKSTDLKRLGCLLLLLFC